MRLLGATMYKASLSLAMFEILELYYIEQLLLQTAHEAAQRHFLHALWYAKIMINSMQTQRKRRILIRFHMSHDS